MSGKILVGTGLFAGLLVGVFFIVLLLSINLVAAQSNSYRLACVDSNGNGILDISELFDVIDAYFDGSAISPTETVIDFAGTGSNRYRHITLTPGDKELTATHDGQGIFRVELIDDKAYSRALVDTTGEFGGMGWIAFRVGDDAQWEFSPGPNAQLVITADGNWTVKVQ